MQKLWYMPIKLNRLSTKNYIFTKWIECLALLFCWMLSPLYSENLTEILKQIPNEDLEDIQDLFSNFIYKGHFAYTLFGDKAVSFACCTISKPSEFPISRKIKREIIQFSNNTLGLKWEKWKRYQALFPIKKFLIIEETAWFSPYTRHIMLINKEQFIKVFNEHQTTFYKELGSQITGEGLLAQVEKRGKLKPSIKYSELLFGILLGYGEHNAALYNERESLKHLYDQYKYVLVKEAPFIKELDRQADKITEILQPFDEYDHLLLVIPSAYFVADSHSKDTRALRKKYQASRKKISAIYAQGNFLEITFSALIKE